MCITIAKESLADVSVDIGAVAIMKILSPGLSAAAEKERRSPSRQIRNRG